MVDRGTFMTNDLSFVDERLRCHAPISKVTPLGEHWKPDNWSVICGRGKECFDHVGNRRFRILVDVNLEKYAAARTKFDKSLIVLSIFDAVREGSNRVGGGFVKQDPKTKRWCLVQDEVAREKIGQQFRVAMAQRRRDGNGGGGTSQSLLFQKSVPVTPRESKSKTAKKQRATTTKGKPQKVVRVISQTSLSEPAVSGIDTDLEPLPAPTVSLSHQVKDLEESTTVPAIVDEIADILDFELDCNEEDLLQIIAATA